MKNLLSILLFMVALCATIFAAAPAPVPVVTVDLYGNVFVDGENTGQQVATFARNNPALAEQVDGAVRNAVIAARAYVAAQVTTKAKEAQDAVASQLAAKDREIAELRARIAQLEKK